MVEMMTFVSLGLRGIGRAWERLSRASSCVIWYGRRPEKDFIDAEEA